MKTTGMLKRHEGLLRSAISEVAFQQLASQVTLTYSPTIFIKRLLSYCIGSY